MPHPDASCPYCSGLDHASTLERLSREAREAGQCRDWTSARSAWEQALHLLPEGTLQRRTVQARIDNIDAQTGIPHTDSNASVWAKRFAKLGPAGVLLWKLKAITLIVLTKGKLLLLGFTKIGTLLSMLASFALYWHWYGWRFALGFVLSIYVHEMGHVAALRKYGIAATAPMFIPGFGAVVRLKQYPESPAQDARVGLAGPIWGLGAGKPTRAS